MIISEILGGLGNQMFQYAAGLALAERSGVPLRLDRTPFDWYALWSYSLPDLAISSATASHYDRLAVAAEGSLIQEEGPRYDKRFDYPHAVAYLKGYWQSERYFAHLRPRLRSEFRPLAPFTVQDVEVATAMSSSVAISMHVRRGDYVSNAQAAAFHGVMGVEYYKVGIAAILDRLPEAERRSVHFFIFSDDPDWCAQTYAFLEPKTIVRHNPPSRGAMDIHLMSLARHHIIANSSFSWWGAWLCGNPEQVVVAPRHWFAAEQMSEHDIVPDRWLRF